MMCPFFYIKIDKLFGIGHTMIYLTFEFDLEFKFTKCWFPIIVLFLLYGAIACKISSGFYTNRNIWPLTLTFDIYVKVTEFFYSALLIYYLVQCLAKPIIYRKMIFWPLVLTFDLKVMTLRSRPHGSEAWTLRSRSHNFVFVF